LKPTGGWRSYVGCSCSTMSPAEVQVGR